MRIKKMLAVLAAISMLASMGVSAAAEDETAATTSEEAVTTVATEATTTMETTTATEMTSAETTMDSEAETTVATEENETVKAYGDKVSFTLNGVTFSAALESDGSGTGIESPFYFVKIYSEDSTQLLSVGVADYRGDESLTEEYVALSTYFSVTGDNEITITTYDGTATSYNYVNGQFVKKGEVVTTATTTTGITTTTTISGEAVTEEMLYNKFVAAYGKPVTVDYGDFNNDGELDAYCTYLVKGTGTVNTYFVTKDSIIYAGVAGNDMGRNDFAYFECSGYRFRANLWTRTPVAYAVGSLTIDRIEADGTLKSVNFGATVLQDNYEMNNTPNFLSDLTAEQACDVSSYFTSNGDMITVTHYLYDNGRDVGSTNYVYDAAKNAFVEGDSPVQPTVLEIHSNDSMTVTGTLSYEWDQINENNNFKHAILTLDTPITVKYMDGEWIGKTETIDSVQIDIEDELSEGTRLEVTGNVMYAHTGHHLRNIVLTDCAYKVLGKKNGGTTLNKPSNTTGTPKTGDVATLPAVALGLTMTAAGVAAIIYKKRK